MSSLSKIENDFREIIDSFRDFRYDLREVQYELSGNSSSIKKVNGLIHDMIFLLHNKTLMFDKFKKWEDMNIERKKFMNAALKPPAISGSNSNPSIISTH